MERPKLIGLLALSVIFCCGIFVVHRSKVYESSSGLLRVTRKNATDLEVTGLLAGVPVEGRRYITYQDLLSLPQTEATVVGDENFTELNIPMVHIMGVRLTELARTLAAAADADMINAVCVDQYRAPYPAHYLTAHQPILVLKINGESTSAWARRNGTPDPGPYLVAYSNFIPSFHILSHVDRPQVPTQVVRLDFIRQKTVFDAIAPPGKFAADSPEMEGFGIARQNCLRCHNRGSSGGTKADRTWSQLSRRAIKDPQGFARYIQGPKSVDSEATMPPNPQYDAVTLAALTAYFQAFSGR